MSYAPPSTPTHIYRALLHLYPIGFRQEFGDEMVCDFDDATGEAWDSAGWLGVLAFWTVVSTDFVRSLGVQWVRSGWPALVGISATWSLSCCVLIAQQIAPWELAPPRNRSEDEMMLMMLSAVTVFVLIAVTIIVTAGFWVMVVRRSRRA